MLVLADGTRLRLRPIERGDRDGLAALFARLSPESRRRRFLSTKPQLSDRELDYFTDVDHVGQEAIAAVDERDGSLVGVARYAVDRRHPAAAHMAVTVADDLQGMGIGAALASRAVKRARASGVDVLMATTLSENRPARALLRRLGFRAVSAHASGIDHELELE